MRMIDKKSMIRTHLSASAKVIQKMEKSCVDDIFEITERIIEALRDGKKVLLCGNGGSAADSQHIAAELVCRFQMNRPALTAIALTTDTSILTAVGNDFGFETLFSRQVEGLGREGDILIGLSTSGSSKNVALAMHRAKQRGLVTIAFVGENPGPVSESADVVLRIPSKITARIQEGHATVGHIICDLVEKDLFEKENGE
jgi:D-sedoheptulose 7-phosphate isomerase